MESNYQIGSIYLYLRAIPIHSTEHWISRIKLFIRHRDFKAKIPLGGSLAPVSDNVE